jgi:peptide chain release factor
LRPRHQRRNWFVQVVPLGRDAHADAPAFDERDVTFRPFRSGGPGGQRRNKVATAVRAEHGPSGRVVVASGERTLAANRAAALLRLADQAARDGDRHERRVVARQRGHHDQVVRGAPVRTVRAPLV